MMFWKNLYKLRIRESDQLKNSVRVGRDGDSSKDIDANYQKNEDDGEKK